jgi:hypothetical protein
LFRNVRKFQKRVVIVSNVGGLTDVAKEDGKEDEAVGGSDQNDAQIHSGNDEEHDWKCFFQRKNRKTESNSESLTT